MLLGANLLFPEKKGGLPYDAEVEYLQGDGQAYILDDRIVLNGAATVRLDVALTDLSYNQDLLGYYATAKKASGFRFGSSGLVIRYSANNRVTLVIDAGSRYTIIGSNSESSILDEDGSILASGSGVNSWTTPLTVFCATSSSASPYARYTTTNPSTARVYKIEIESESVNADLIPVRKGSVGYMYDRVSGKLYGNSAGEGAFIVGPDKGAKPYDAEVEWLQGDGVAYIDNVIDFGGETATTIGIDYDIVVSVPDGTTGGVVFAFCPRTNPAQGSMRLIVSTTAIDLHSFSNVSSGRITLTNPSTYAEIRATYTKTNGGTADLTLVGYRSVSNTPSGTYVSPLVFGLPLFCYKYVNSSGDVIYSNMFGGRIHSARIKNLNTGAEVDLIPVRKDGVGYFYDKISGQLFGNSASRGAFTVGPDK